MLLAQRHPSREERNEAPQPVPPGPFPHRWPPAAVTRDHLPAGPHQRRLTPSLFVFDLLGGADAALAELLFEDRHRLRVDAVAEHADAVEQVLTGRGAGVG